MNCLLFSVLLVNLFLIGGAGKYVVITDEMLYGLPIVPLTEAVITAYKGDVDRAKQVLQTSSDDCQDYPYIVKLLQIPKTSCTIANLGRTIKSWMYDGEYSTNNTELEALVDEYLLGDLLTSPETLGDSDIIKKLGAAQPRAYWDDWPSQRYFNRTAKRLKLFRRNLKSIKVASSNLEGKMTYDNLKWFVDDAIDFNSKWVYQMYTVTQLGGIQDNVVSLARELTSKEDIESWIERLRNFRYKFRMIRQHFFLSVHPPSFILQKVLNQSKRIVMFLSSPANPLIKTLERSISRLSLTDEKEELINKTKKCIDGVVLPGLKEFNNLTEQAIQKGIRRANKAGCEINRSRRKEKAAERLEYYKACVRKHTTTLLSPQTIHMKGREEVYKIKQKIKKLITQINSEGDKLLTADMSFKEIFKVLRHYKPFFYEGNREATINSIQKIIDIVDNKMQSYFVNSTYLPLKVEGFQDTSNALGTYSQPTADYPFGQFNVNFGMNLSRIMMRSVVCHEAIPGHHFQIGRIVSKPNLNKLNRANIWYSANLEGWALYAETLCGEIGVMDERGDDIPKNVSVKYFSIGKLSGLLFRAARLVVDTGIHARKWSREKAIKYLQENTNAPFGLIESEVDRYIVTPGRSLAYYTGYMEIMKLRKLIKTRMGDDFNISTFHETILDAGSLPLEVLKQYVIKRYDLQRNNSKL